MMQQGIHYSRDLERELLGIMLHEPNAFDLTANLLDADSFYHADTQTVYNGLAQMINLGYPVSLITVTDYLRQHMVTQLAGDDANFYLSTLYKSVTTTAHMQRLACRLREMQAKREMLKLATIGADAQADPFDQALRIQQLMQSILDLRNMSDWRSMKDIAKRLTDQMDEAAQNELPGVTTSIAQVDNANGGFRQGQLVIIAARPGMGKSAFMSRIALHAAQSKKTVGIISLEMDDKDVLARMASIETGIKHRDLDGNRMDEQEREKVLRHLGRMCEEYPVYMSDCPEIDLAEIRSKVSRLKKIKGLDLLIIDYLQLINTARSKIKSREQEVAELSRGLKMLAMQEQIPIIVLAQLNRNAEARADRKPALADLRESGSLEQDADIVMLLHRDEAAGIVTNRDGPTTGQADLIIPKWRNGATMNIKLGFDKERMRFYERESQN